MLHQPPRAGARVWLEVWVFDQSLAAGPRWIPAIVRSVRGDGSAFYATPITSLPDPDPVHRCVRTDSREWRPDDGG